MAFDDLYRLSAHAVISDEAGKVLQLKQTYLDKRWGLPGGAVEPGETVHEAVTRECKEELGVDIEIEYLSGVYYHSAYTSHVFIFRCSVPGDEPFALSAEHSEYGYFGLEELSDVQRQRVQDCLEFEGVVQSAKF